MTVTRAGLGQLGRPNDIRKIYFVHQLVAITVVLSIMYHTADCNCILQYFLFIIKNDLLEKTVISTDRTAPN